MKPKRAGSDWGAIAALLLLGLVLGGVKVVAIPLVVLALSWAALLVVLSVFRRADKWRVARAERVRRLEARASAQDRQYLAGDERGLYGSYRPAPLD